MPKLPKRPSKTKPAASPKLSVRGKTTTNKSSNRKSIEAGQTHVIFGILTSADATPLAGLTVIAYDKDESREDRLGQATTDAAGAYMIPYSEASFRKTPKERGGADVIVRVYNEKSEVLFASKTKNNAPAEYQLNIQLPTQQYVVRGTVADANGKPLPNLIVRAFERDLRIPQSLGTSHTGTNGDYRIEYRPADFQLGDLPSRRAPWLIVDVRETDEGDALARQEIQRADRDQVVSFTLSNVGAISEWQRISEAVAPLLKGQGAPLHGTGTHETRADLLPEDITANDLKFVVLETGLDRIAVQAWALSSQMVRDAVLRLTDEHADQQRILQGYGWPFFYGLVRQRGARDLDALLREPAQNVIQTLKAAVSTHQIPPQNEKHVELLLDVLMLLQRLQQLDPAHDSTNTFARVLADAPMPLPAAVALDALAVFQEKGFDDPDALLKLAERYPDAAAPIKTFVRRVRVHQLTTGHERLSRVLHARLEGVSDSIAPLAKMRVSDWIGLAEEAGVSPGVALQTQVFAELLHPLTALESKVQAGTFDLPGVSGNDIAAMIKNQPATVEKLLLGKRPVKAEEAETNKALRNAGRFLRTGVSMELAANLIKGGISSPGKALFYGRDFIRQQLLDMPQGAAQEVADNLFDTAEPWVNSGNGLVIGMQGDRAYPSWMFEDVPLAVPEPVRENAPTLAALFGDLDECTCTPCESMLGQPAYLVDLLKLLGPNIHWLLKQKRPGIFTLPLVCENADPEKTIQHIDIVLEVLAAATAGLGNNATQVEIEEAAYDTLARAVFPWTLPFRRPYAEAMAYLAKLNVSRFDLLTLRSNPQTNELAAETLGVSFPQQWALSEWRLLTESRTDADLWRVYGLDRLGVSGSGFPLFDPASGEDISGKSREEVLIRASVLMDITGWELDDFERVLSTKFVSGSEGELRLSNRNQCKTSEMRVQAKGQGDDLRPVVALQGCLDRLHRFTRLLVKLSGWSIAQLDKAIELCGGIELGPSVGPQRREELLVKLAIIKRLHDEHGLPLDDLLDRPISAVNLRKPLGLSILQFDLLKAITAFDPAATVQSFTWAELEDFCNAAKRIHESGLSIEQVAHALLTRSQLSTLFGELPSAIKSDEQIEGLLGEIQSRLREAFSGQADEADLAGESQVAAALTQIFDEPTSRKIVSAIRSAGAESPIAPVGQLRSALVSLLTHSPATVPGLGEWPPLLNVTQANSILDVASSHNPDADARFGVLLTGIAEGRRKRNVERALISIVAEQSGLPEGEVVPLLGSRLLLDPPAQGQPAQAAETFLDTRFWADIPPPTTTNPPTPSTVPGVARTEVPLLHTWMDRLYRLIALRTALKIDSALMLLADPVVVNGISMPQLIDWRELLASTPSAPHSAWTNPHWQALLDFSWLQQPDELSYPALGELLNRLTAFTRAGAQTVTAEAVRPLATRLEIPDAQVLAIAAQTVTVTTDNLRNPSKLRRVYRLLMLARRLGATDTQIAQIANFADIAQAAATAKSLLEARVSGEEQKDVWQAINDTLRQRRRDAFVAHLIGNVRLDTRNYKKFNNVNDLYEYYLIDPQMEPCFETTRISEAITATQLFAQRLLFGLEAGQVARKELKDRWTWMRNYRVWEANRKVFLFPENWLFPELRDDKSSSFKQLESALGQGELTEDLANQAFGQFLDDVAQMGQIEVLGMYEDILPDDEGFPLRDKNGFLLRRTLYVIGRTPNPPYAYFWRHCVDFGSPYMEWSPWQRIELDIQGDHVLPFVLGSQLYIAWPIIRAIKIGSEKAAKDGWEVKLAWSRYDGKSWRKSSISRDFWSGEAAAFSDERRGFAFRCKTSLDDSKASIFVYTISDDTGTVREVDPTPADGQPTRVAWDNATQNPIYAADETAAMSFLKTLIANDDNFDALPERTKKQIRIYELIRLNWESGAEWSTLHGMLKPNAAFGGRWSAFLYPDKNDPINPQFASNTSEEYEAWKPNGANLNDLPSRHYRERFIDDFVLTARLRVDSSRQEDYKYFNYFYGTLERTSSRRTVVCKAWIKLKAPDGKEPIAYIPLTGDANEGVYTCRIGTETIPFNPGVPYPMDWKLGDQPEVRCILSLIPRVSPASTIDPLEAPQGTVCQLGSIEKGYEATQTLHFVIDGTMHNAIDIGFDLDAFKVLKMVGQFFLTRDDMVSQLPLLRSQSPIYNPVEFSRPWMNGFREIATGEDENPNHPLQIAHFSAVPLPIFKTSGASQFWVVGAASWSWHIPISWYYSESGFGGYIDLGNRMGLPDSGILVYPDSYPEATLRRSDWAQSRSLPVAQNQKSGFGSQNLPTPEINGSTKWTDIQEGIFTFDSRLPYACYNWEVFFHAPLLVADQLSKQHKFEEAERWLRFVFDPTSTETGADAKRFLKFRVFHELELNKQVIDDLTALAQAAAGLATDPAVVEKVKNLINRWRDAPFRPFLIARRRHIAFLWRTLFAYLDNLIAWADSLYRRDTRESINEATMLYVLAERILGRRPKLHKGNSHREALSYEGMNAMWDEFANFWIDVGSGSSNRPTGKVFKDKNWKKHPNPDGMLYFCMPFNDRILSYWNTLDARLSNIRNCRSIEGIQRSLPLMDAPIDPELLIRATAAGLDLGEVINGLYAPPPHYRYSILSSRAAELANECKVLGAAMLSAIEKRDAEYLAQLRSSNEITLLKLVRDVRTLQVAEAERNIEALRASRKTISARYAQYQRLLGKKEIKTLKENESAGEEAMLGTIDSGLASNRSNWGLIKEENEQYIGIEGANTWSVASSISKIIGSGFNIAATVVIPNPAAKAAGAHEVLTALGLASSTMGDAFSAVSQGWRAYADQQGMMAGHIRRRDEWAFQSNQTLKEMQQIDKQILANQIRIDITKNELSNHQEQIEQAKAVDEVMRSKFSNVQLYEWMKTELSRLYFNAYRMTLEMARKAERAASRELGVKPLNVVRNDYWDSLRDGLLAGERLHQDLKRLEISYLDQNRREYELTKHISLRRLDPKALVQLRAKAAKCTCEFDIPEWLFDLDAPGHYLRRIKSVSVSIPSVTGPYSSVNCKLTLLQSAVRHANTGSTGEEYLRSQDRDDPRFTDYFGATEAIVTSTGNADSGMFEAQLRDERFLPFEGSGVKSTWRLELPADYPQFDYSTISDVVLTIRYTARDGGDALRNAATAAIQEQLTLPDSGSDPQPLRFQVLLSCRSDFPTEWARAIAGTSTGASLEIPITRTLLPYWMDAVRVGSGSNVKQLQVREVSAADLRADPTSMPTFAAVPPPTGTRWTLETVPSDGSVTDRLVLLSVGLPG